MKDTPGSFLEKDIGENMKWRQVSQKEVDHCWKKLAEKMEDKVLDKYKVEDSKREAGLPRQRLFFGMEACTKKQELQDTKLERRLLGKNLRFVQRVQFAASANHP